MTKTQNTEKKHRDRQYNKHTHTHTRRTEQKQTTKNTTNKCQKEHIKKQTDSTGDSVCPLICRRRRFFCGVPSFVVVVDVVGFDNPVLRRSLPRRRLSAPLTKGEGGAARQFRPPLPCS